MSSHGLDDISGGNNPNTLYETDYHQWAVDTAAALRSGRIRDVNLAEVAEEIESLGKQQQQQLVNRLAVLIAHVLQWEHQTEKRTASWSGTIREQQRRLEKLLRKNPSLTPLTAESVEDAYGIATVLAPSETQLPEDDFPASCPYTWNDLITYQPTAH